jgi:hypothetical protein
LKEVGEGLRIDLVKQTLAKNNGDMNWTQLKNGA